MTVKKKLEEMGDSVTVIDASEANGSGDMEDFLTIGTIDDDPDWPELDIPADPAFLASAESAYIDSFLVAGRADEQRAGCRGARAP